MMGGSVVESNALINTPSKLLAMPDNVQFHDRLGPIGSRRTVGTSTPDFLLRPGRDVPLEGLPRKPSPSDDKSV